MRLGPGRIWITLSLALAACGGVDDPIEPAPARSSLAPVDSWAASREAMVELQIRDRGVQNELVLGAMRTVPRHEFVPQKARKLAYSDHPLHIGYQQTISQPYIVAIMTELADIGPGSKVLEIGTGSGYGAAVLAQIAKEVYTIEIIEGLAVRAEGTLERLGYKNIHVRHGDGYRGWPEAAPFDAIVVTAAPPRVPEPLKQQLKVGGKLVLPVGERHQEMRVIDRTTEGYLEQPLFRVRFVPMIGEVRQGADSD